MRTEFCLSNALQWYWTYYKTPSLYVVNGGVINQNFLEASQSHCALNFAFPMHYNGIGLIIKHHSLYVVNGGVAHEKQQILEIGDIQQHDVA